MSSPHERRQRWAEALRSGDYVQTRGVLKRVHLDGAQEYCCLGVACELAIADGIEVEWSANHLASETNPESILGFRSASRSLNVGALPGPVAEYYGVTPDGELLHEVASDNGDFTCEDLVGLNDDLEYTFTQIAEQIEDQNLRSF